ncbi:unnamed protein product [Caenorhabditis angaria]|uniref:Uncharacterized protein n=1 Tax=Caenorhabditis angaria TaxID=860376 RepID=A0A9P1IDL6_9PELO|nr:unnamed protein product [Caenorhabditis angaria]
MSDDVTPYGAFASLYIYIMVGIASIGSVGAVCLLVIFIPTLIEKMIRTAAALQSTAKIVESTRLSAAHYTAMANLKNSNKENEIYKAYDSLIKNNKTEVGRVFGMDKLTNQFIKIYESDAVCRRK